MKKIFTKFYTILAFCLISFVSNAQITTGDIAFVGINSDASPNELAIVTLAPIASGQQIIITDYAWNGSSLDQSNSIAEGVITWTTNTSIQAGTIIKFTIDAGAIVGGGLSSYGTVSATGWSGDAIASGGDNWFILTGSIASPNFIYAYANWSTATYGVKTWPTTGVSYPNATISYLPSGLTNGTTANIQSGDPLYHFDNNVYIGTKSGSKADILAALTVSSNWSGSESTVPDIAPGGSNFTGSNPLFTIGTPATITQNPSNNAICVGSNTTFSITATNATGYQWQVNTGSGFTNISNNSTYSNATTATLTITGATISMNGYTYQCIASGSPNATSNAATLTVNSLPTITATGGTFCAGANGVNLTSNGAGNGTYAWSPTTNLSASNIANPTATPSSSTNYTVIGTDINGCSNSVTVSVTVIQLPTISNVVGETRCDAGQVNLQATATARTNGQSLTINWYDVQSGGSVIATGTSYSPNVTSTTTYYVEAVNTGCKSANRSAVDAIVINTPQAPIQDVVTFCGHGSAVLYANSAVRTNNNPITYNWYDVQTGGTILGSGTSFTTPDLTISKDYFVEASNGNCTSLRVKSPVVIKFIPATPYQKTFERCGEGEFNLESIYAVGRQGGTLTPMYNWYTTSTGGSPIAQVDTLLTGVISKDSIFYVSQEFDGCESDRAAIYALVNPIPVKPYTMNDTACAFSTLDLYANNVSRSAKKQSCRGCGTYDFYWYSDNQLTNLIGQGTSIAVTINDAPYNQYFVKVIDDNGCESDTTSEIVYTHTVNTQVTTSTNLLTANESGNSVSYQWLDCDAKQIIVGETAQTFSPINSGNYAVIVSDLYCSDTSNCYNLTITGLENSANSLANIYPNPANNYLTIQLNNVSEANVTISDINGSTVYSTSVNSVKSNLNISNLTSGVYFVKISSGETQNVQKLTVVK